MKRLWTVVLGAVVLAACKVEQTPAEYIDHTDPIDVVRVAAQDEIQDRILAMGQALSRGSAAEALTALSPAEDAYILLPRGDTVLAGPTEIAEALRALSDDASDLQMRNVEVMVGPRANIAWFRAVLEVRPEPPAEASTLRITGVYILTEGLWELVQAHLSLPVSRPPPPNPDAAPDSAEAG